MKCEKCGKEHDGAYGSGRFCGSSCARSFATRVKREEINAKVSEKLRGVNRGIDLRERGVRGGQGRQDLATRDKTEAYSEADSIWSLRKNDPKFLFGLALYIGEGNKRGSTPGISNCDARVIRSALVFFETLGVTRDEVKVHLGVHTEDQVESAEVFWCSELGVSRTQFRKTMVNQVGRKTPRESHRQPYGCCQIRAQGRRLMSIIERLSDLAFVDFASHGSSR